MSNLRTVVAAAGLVAIGFWLAPRQPGERGASEQPAAARMQGPAVDMGALRAEVRASVRAELTGHPPTLDPAAPDQPVAEAVLEPSAEPSAEQQAAADRALSFVEDVAAGGRLTEDDIETLRPMLATMAAEDAMEVRRSLVRAINSQSLAVDGPLMLP